MSALKSAPPCPQREKHCKSVLYYIHKYTYISTRNRGLIRGGCKIFPHIDRIGFGAHQTIYLTNTTSLSPRSNSAGAWIRSFLSLYLRRYERVELHLHSTICPHVVHRGQTYIFLFTLWNLVQESVRRLFLLKHLLWPRTLKVSLYVLNCAIWRRKM